MHNFGGQSWKDWNSKMQDLLVKSQEIDAKNATRHGSWNPKGDPWGEQGGRLMVTSLSVLILEVNYRHFPSPRSPFANPPG